MTDEAREVQARQYRAAVRASTRKSSIYADSAGTRRRKQASAVWARPAGGRAAPRPGTRRPRPGHRPEGAAGRRGKRSSRRIRLVASPGVALCWAPTSSDDKGRFLIRGLGPGKVLLQIEGETITPQRSEVEPVRAESAVTVTLSASPGQAAPRPGRLRGYRQARRGRHDPRRWGHLAKVAGARRGPTATATSRSIPSPRTSTQQLASPGLLPQRVSAARRPLYGRREFGARPPVCRTRNSTWSFAGACW